MKPQIFKYMWGKPLDGDRYIRTRDIVHALGNSDQYPFSLGQRPKTPEEEFGHKAMIETINAVVAAIEAAPQYVWQDGRLTRETDEEGNARRQEAVGLRERGYVVILANSFATPVEAKNAAIRISERIAAEEGVFVVMELT